MAASSSARNEMDGDTSLSNSRANADEAASRRTLLNHDEESRSRHSAARHAPENAQLQNSISHISQSPSQPHATGRGDTHEESSYDIPDEYVNLDELAATSPVENPDEARVNMHESLEESTTQEQTNQESQEGETNDARRPEESPQPQKKDDGQKTHNVSRFATKLYTISYLILFSLLGTLARLGLQSLTFYPGAPVAFSVLWANFAGSAFIGFLSEDRMLFKDEWGTPTYHQEIQRAREHIRDEENSSGSNQTIDLQAAKKAHAATKKTIPLYIGLATGFCGCFTSFSSFIRDVFLALSNDLPSPLNHPAASGANAINPKTTSTIPRNGGYSFMALLAVIIVTVTVCISGLHLGAHLAIVSEPFIPSFPFRFLRKFLDRIAVVLAWGCWLGAILLAILPPDRHSGSPETWRGRALFALVFAPLGCLGRFYTSIYLNGKIASFPLGTFVVNIFGTAVLGMSYDLQRVPLGGVVGCQVLQGVEDGFCGCLTTVSTWVAELSSLRRRHAYKYGAVSVLVALAFLVVIMGSLQWTKGFAELRCKH